ncbi:uncharacterized protein LOC112347376 [Selaginella moellendorffii]|uniref:uncharacterized protein LOC112347376 n=1 Tax=Selaginella moellendorffii TaxID=88036 RepID=UPI000D1C81F5|nr:uncharacterized protein LOC112347376 [Selaginella moellendorffii]|eukprot:XP_024533880.1 uncharacterized protein LOC112347376 [Selaginella moellendorffii]
MAMELRQRVLPRALGLFLGFWDASEAPEEYRVVLKNQGMKDGGRTTETEPSGGTSRMSFGGVESDAGESAASDDFGGRTADGSGGERRSCSGRGGEAGVSALFTGGGDSVGVPTLSSG